jgi:hypothetical protein
MFKLSFGKALSLPYHPWIYFFIFLAANIVLSYLDLQPKWFLGVGLLGMVVPFGVALASQSPSGSNKPLYRREFLPEIPLWAWGAIAAGAIFVRFYKLTTLFLWPNGDEGSYISIVLSIMRKGVDRLLYSSIQVPFVYPWWLNLQFKLWGPSLANLWFWPAFFSALTLPLCYLAARRYFSRSFSFLCVLIMAFCFWVWYLARFSECTALIPLAETWVLLGMGKLLGETLEKERRITAFVLGLGLGLVLYAIYLHWLAVIGIVAVTVLYQTRKSPALAGLFLIAFILTAGPFALLALDSGYSGYVGYLASQGVDLGRLNFSYFKSIFWGLPVQYYTYQPSWGGFLNPILGSLCFLGILEALKNFSDGLYRWLLASFVYFLLPGMLSRDSEAYRVLPVLAAVIPLAALGIARLLENLAPYRAALVLMALFLPSIGADFYHLAGPCHRLWNSPDYWWNSVKSINSYKAYSILKEKSLTDGTGMVFQDFNPNNSDQTLSLATYSFDALADRRRSFEEARWAALLVNVHYRPFLERQCGGGKAFWLSKDLHIPDGGRMLWIIPVTNSNRAMLRRWYEADLALDNFRDASFQSISYFWGQPSAEPLRILEKAYPAFRDDPFLRSCFWEKMADYDFKSRRVPEAMECLQEALRKGYPAAQLYYRLGMLSLAHGNKDAARTYLKEVVRSPMDFTNSRQLLEQLGSVSSP